jgi:hypothetical protein
MGRTYYCYILKSRRCRRGKEESIHWGARRHWSLYGRAQQRAVAAIPFPAARMETGACGWASSRRSAIEAARGWERRFPVARCGNGGAAALVEVGVPTARHGRRRGENQRLPGVVGGRRNSSYGWM